MHAHMNNAVGHTHNGAGHANPNLIDAAVYLERALDQIASLQERNLQLRALGTNPTPNTPTPHPTPYLDYGCGIRINPTTGEVIIPPDLSITEAAAEFWRTVRRMIPIECQQPSQQLVTPEMARDWLTHQPNRRSNETDPTPTTRAVDDFPAIAQHAKHLGLKL